mgnify:CR=1 FL=1
MLESLAQKYMALKLSRVRAVLLNSGGANACTGPQGFADTHASAERLALMLVEARRYKPIELHGDQRKGDEHAAKHCNCAVGTIKSRIARARRELEGRFNRVENAPPAALHA